MVTAAVLIGVWMALEREQPTGWASRRVVGELTAVGVLLDATATSTAPRPTPPLRLPDLVALSPGELFVSRNLLSGQRELRFSTSIGNVGDGALALVGEADETTGRVYASQQIELRNGRGVVERPVGDFVFHAGHAHWHFENFIEFELWSHAADGRLLTRLATTGKITYCLMDNQRIGWTTPPLVAKTQFAYCGPRVQGISPGWADVYVASLPGQELAIAALADGAYALRTVVDPEDRVLEADEGNNAVVVYVHLIGDRIERRLEP